MTTTNRELFESLTPANRTMLVLLQMRLGQYMDGEMNICKQVNIIRHAGEEYVTPVLSPSISMDMRPFEVGPIGDVMLSINRVRLDGTSEYVGMLDIMSGSVDMLKAMQPSDEAVQRGREQFKQLARSPYLYQSSEPIRFPVERAREDTTAFKDLCSGIETGGYSPAAKASLTGCGRLNESEYFHRKMHLGIGTKGHVGRTPIIGFWTRMGWKWANFKERVAESRVVHFFKSLFNR